MTEADWMKLLQVVLIGGMLILLFPRVKQALKDSPKATSNDWQALLLPILAVVGFVILLILMV